MNPTDRIVIIVRNLLVMLRDRGYNLSDAELRLANSDNVSVDFREEFLAYVTSHPDHVDFSYENNLRDNIVEIKSLVSKIYDSKIHKTKFPHLRSSENVPYKLKVIFLLTEEGRRDALISQMGIVEDENQIDGILVITDIKPNHLINRNLGFMNIDTQVMMTSHLYNNPTTHVRGPEKYEVLSPNQKEIAGTIPLMLSSDPIAAHYNYPLGTILRITYRSRGGVPTVTYRKVV